MPATFEGGDAVNLWLTHENYSIEARTQDSVGGYAAGTTPFRGLVSWRVVNPIPGVRIIRVSAACSPGDSLLAATGPDSLAFSGRSGGVGPSVEFQSGHRCIEGGDPSQFVVVQRTATPFAGAATIRCEHARNGPLIGTNYNIDVDFGGRTHMAAFRNRGTQLASNVKVWSPTTGPMHILGSNAATALPSSGAATITLPRDSHWESNVHHVLRLTAAGALTEVLVGHVRHRRHFVVASAGRGQYGTSASVGVAGDILIPWGGLRSEGVYLYGAGGEGSIDTRLADEFAERIAPTWANVYSESGAQGYVLRPGDTDVLGVWLYHRGMGNYNGFNASHPAREVSLAWSYNVDGKRYVQFLTNLFGVEQDISAERYLGYRELGAGAVIDIERSDPIIVGSALPLDVPTQDGAVNSVLVAKQNDFGLITPLARGEFNVADGGGEVPAALHPPQSLKATQTAAATIRVQAVYVAALDDPNQADGWRMTFKNLDTGAHFDVTAGVHDPAVDTLDESVSFPGWAWADSETVRVTVLVERSSDSGQSASIYADVVLSEVEPDAPDQLDIEMDVHRIVRN